MVISPKFLSPGRFRRVGLVAVAIVVVVPLLLVGIGRLSRGSSDGTTRTTAPPYYAVSGTAAPAPAATAAAGRSAGGVPSAAPIPSGSTTNTTAGAPSGTTSDVVGVNVPPATSNDQKIIRTGSMAMTVRDVPGTMNAIWGLASEMGGIV